MSEGFTTRSLREELYKRLWQVMKRPSPRLLTKHISEQERVEVDLRAELKIVGGMAADYVLRNKYKDLWGKPISTGSGWQDGLLHQWDEETGFKHGFHNHMALETANFAAALLQKLTVERLMTSEGLSPAFREGLLTLENRCTPQIERARANIMNVFREGLAVTTGKTNPHRIEMEVAQLIHDIENTVLGINPDKDYLARIFQETAQDSINPKLPRRG